VAGDIEKINHSSWSTRVVLRAAHSRTAEIFALSRHAASGFTSTLAGVDRTPDCPVPLRFAVMKQGWFDLVSLHWRYDPAEVAKILPDGLEVDTFDGSAWVGLIPFSMRGVGLPHLPGVPYLGSFPEVNVRTYVVRDGVPGVWFCSLDVNRLIPALVARASYRLPYCWGAASHQREGTTVTTSVHRRWPNNGPRTSVTVNIGDEEAHPSELDIFLTARWGLYSHGRGGRLRYASVEHPRWPLFRGSLEALDDTLVRSAGLRAPTGEPHVLFSPGVPVRIGLPRTVR
jgi:uncharacterized protein